jgi:hypothetical protein
MMELASNLVAGGPNKLPAMPVMFLFSGAEEPLCQVWNCYISVLHCYSGTLRINAVQVFDIAVNVLPMLLFCSL